MTKESNNFGKVEALEEKKTSIIKATIDAWRALPENKVLETILSGDFILAHQATLTDFVKPGEEVLAGGWKIHTTSNSVDRVGTLYASPDNIRHRSAWLRGVSKYLAGLGIQQQYHAGIMQTKYFGRYADLPELAYVLSKVGTPFYEDYMSLTGLFSDRDYNDWRKESGVNKIPELSTVSRQAHLRIVAMVNIAVTHNQYSRNQKKKPAKSKDRKWVADNVKKDKPAPVVEQVKTVDPAVAETSYADHAPHIQQEHADILNGTAESPPPAPTVAE